MAHPFTTPVLRWFSCVWMLTVSFLATESAAQNALEVSGLYQGENLLVVNETTPDGVGFCCYQVRVNGLLTGDQVNSHAFEIDLAAHGLVLGKGVSVRLLHRPGCAPRILNPEVILPSPGFELVSFTALPSGEVSWVTSAERGRMPFVLQQRKWNKWVDVVRVDGQGGPEEARYAAQVQPIPGENWLRLTHLAPDGTLAVKGEVRFEAAVPTISMEHFVKDQRIQFSRPTQYEVIDIYGTVVLRGRGDEVILRYLARGEYFVNFGGRSETFKKR